MKTELRFLVHYYQNNELIDRILFPNFFIAEEHANNFARKYPFTDYSISPTIVSLV